MINSAERYEGVDYEDDEPALAAERARALGHDPATVADIERDTREVLRAKSETADKPTKPGDLYDAIRQNLSRSQALADLLSHADLGDDSADTAACHMYELIKNANDNVGQLWDQLKPAPRSKPSDGGNFRNADGFVATAEELFEDEKRIGGMSLEDVLKRLDMHTWRVLPAPEHQLTDAPGYIVTKTFTEKGLRWFLALMEFYEDFCGEYQALKDADEADSAPEPKVSNEADRIDEARLQGQYEQMLSAKVSRIGGIVEGTNLVAAPVSKLSRAVDLENELEVLNPTMTQPTPEALRVPG